MAKDFNFSAGEADMGPLASVLGSAMQTIMEAARLKAGAASGASAQIGAVLESALSRSFEAGERKADRELAETEAARGRVHGTSERKAGERFDLEVEDLRERRAKRAAELQRAESARLSELEGVQRILETGIREQGLDAPQSAEALQRLFQQTGGVPQMQPGAGPNQMLGVGPPTAGMMRLGMGAMPVGFQPPTAPPQQGLQGIQRHPPPMTFEEKRFRFTEAQKGRVAQNVLQLKRLQAQEDKGVVVKRKRRLADALGFGGLDKMELEAAVRDAYGWAKPARTLEGGEEDDPNAEAVKAKIEFLTEKRDVEVPNGPGLTGLEWSSGGGPEVVRAAIEEAVGPIDSIPMTTQDMDRYADQKLLEGFPEYVNRFNRAQVQRADPLALAQEQGKAKAALSEPKPAAFNKGLLQTAQIEIDQLPDPLRSAVLAGMTITVGPDGRLMFQPRKDGTVAPPSWQAALDALAPDVQERLRAVMATGAESSQTPSEVKDAATRRKMSGKTGAPPTPEPAGGKIPSGVQAGKPQSGAPSSPGKSALEAYRASKMKPEGKKPKALKAPPSMSLVGLPPETLLEMILAGASKLP